MGILWSFWERHFGGRMEWGVLLFNGIIGSILTYGAELWGWKVREEVERVQERFGRWMLGVDKCTPGYIVRDELNWNKMRVRTGKLAIGYEEKVRGSDKKLAKNSCRERGTKDREGKIRDRERERYLNRCGQSSGNLERLWAENVEVKTLLVERDKEVDLQERLSQINNSNFNKSYKLIRSPGLPSYLSNREKKRERT